MREVTIQPEQAAGVFLHHPRPLSGQGKSGSWEPKASVPLGRTQGRIQPSRLPPSPSGVLATSGSSWLLMTLVGKSLQASGSISGAENGQHDP